MKIAFSFLFLFLLTTGYGQSRVFRDVSSEISSQMKPITQEESLIGYLLFSQLERANKDSFNYQITIIDENLNDLGKVNFRDRNLTLQNVSFDNDIICLVYLKSDIPEYSSQSVRSLRKSTDEAYYITTQLVNLQGQIVATSSEPVEVRLDDDIQYSRVKKTNAIAAHLKHEGQVKNVTGKGFAIFYGDYQKNRLKMIDFTGKQQWAKEIPTARGYTMLTTTSDVYMLTKQDGKAPEGGWELTAYSLADGKGFDKYELKDKYDNELSVLGFQKDPTSGMPVVTGNIINRNLGSKWYRVSHLSKGVYNGVYTIKATGPKKSQMKMYSSNWKEGVFAPEISKVANVSEYNLYSRFYKTHRDYAGNTWFIGSGYAKKPRIGTIAGTIITLPTVIGPILFASSGFTKTSRNDVLIFKQDSSGRLSVNNRLEAEHSRFVPAAGTTDAYDARSFYTVSNSDSKSSFIIVDQAKSTLIYNLEKKKVVRNVPFKDGNVRTYIYPAKEGHIMVVEKNVKAKETKLSIESL